MLKIPSAGEPEAGKALDLAVQPSSLNLELQAERGSALL